MKFVVISLRESTTIFSHVMDAPAFLKDPFAETDNTFAKPTRKVLVLWTKREGISVELAD